MRVDVSLAPLWITLLCSFRLLPVLVLTPILGSFPIPATLKTMIVLALSAAMASSHDGSAPLPGSALELAGMAFLEFSIGVLLSIGIHVVFGAASLAGRLIDLQAGFSLGAIFDPLTKRPTSVLQSALGALCLVMFFSLDMHLVLLRMLSESLRAMPVGASWSDIDLPNLISRGGTIFSLGLAFAAPAVMLLFLLDVGMAVMSRSVPQLNVTFLGIGLKLVIALGVLTLLAATWGAAFRRMFELMVGR